MFDRYQFFFHLPQYKLLGPITQLWYKLGTDIKCVCLSDNNIQIL